jgi:multiple sugar transport system ATP-binding protein
MASVEFRRLVKRYGPLEVVHAIDLKIADGEFIVLVGPSGCGKSTTLRMLAGLEDISDGEILIGSRTVNEIEPRHRDIAMVFQDYALYPHMSVYENMAFSLRYRNTPRAEIGARVREAAEILGLTPYLERRPKQLTVFVTHDQIEAMTLADRVVVMNGGHIEQVGTPDEVYHAPTSLFVAGFIGAPTMNLIPAQRSGASELRLGENGQTMTLPRPIAAPVSALVLGMRPEDVDVAQGAPLPGQVDVSAIVEVVEPLGADTLVFTTMSGHPVVARVRPGVRPKPGAKLDLRFNLERSHLFDAASGKALSQTPH